MEPPASMSLFVRDDMGSEPTIPLPCLATAGGSHRDACTTPKDDGSVLPESVHTILMYWARRAARSEGHSSRVPCSGQLAALRLVVVRFGILVARSTIHRADLPFDDH
jgi:hypothetical protein